MTTTTVKFDDAQQDPDCPICGTPINSYDSRAGYVVAIPHPITGVEEHIIGTGDTVFDHPNFRLATQPPRRFPARDELTLGPCGHTLEGAAAQRILAEFAVRRHLAKRAEADAAITAAGELLAAADAAGHAELAEAYRAAARGSTGDAPGLLAALRILHGSKR